jgi:hypothetical protein
MTEDPAVSTPPATSSEPTSAAPTASSGEVSATPVTEPRGEVSATPATEPGAEASATPATEPSSPSTGASSSDDSAAVTEQSSLATPRGLSYAPPPVPPTPRRRQLRELPSPEELIRMDPRDLFSARDLDIRPLPGGCLVSFVPRRGHRRSPS